MIYWHRGGLMLIYDTISHLVIADDQYDILSFPTPTKQALQDAQRTMILSSSGWRKVFAQSGDEEDPTPSISEADAILSSFAALALARFLNVPSAQPGCLHISSIATEKTQPPTILVGMDARPTGRVIGDIVCRTLTALGCKVRYLFICAAPEIMADCNLHPEQADAFLYISASHNPIGHNGFKFGRNGGVFGEKESNQLTAIFRSLVEEEGLSEYVQKLSASIDDDSYLHVLNSVKRQKRQSLERYEKFVLSTACKSNDEQKQRAFSRLVQENALLNPIGIVSELNGSARSVSIDYFFLKSLGLQVHILNNKPGQIVHGIVPEGENLELCRKTLEDLYKKNDIFKLGYVPDNDGDRGNLVYIEESSKKAKILEAQSGFALVVLSELCQARLENPSAKIAVAVNGPTSMRIDRICDLLNVHIFRSEVGEANVVELAQKLREQDYLVPILGEGSNGGNITHPAKVRDPMNTIMSLIKLLSNREIFKLWCMATNKEMPYNLSLEKILATLPAFTTTGAFSEKGKMQVTVPHRDLKAAYEELFLKEWDLRQEKLKELHIEGYHIYQMEGTQCHQGMGEKFRHPPYSGGLKVVFCNKNGVETDFIWMRGSKTEPVFRILADCEGINHARHDYLLAWQRDMIGRANEMAACKA